MTEENKKPEVKEQKETATKVAETKAETKQEHKHTEKKEEKKTEDKHEHKHDHAGHSHAGHDHAHDHKQEDKKEKQKPKQVKPVVKKEEAIARGESVRISRKQGEYICSFIKGKEIDTAINDLQQVTKMKKAVPYKGEIPHRKGPMMSGRYPIKASGYFINMLKGLKGNVIVNGMELEKTRIYFAQTSLASRPAKSGGRRAKRAHVVIKAKEFEGGKKKK